MKRLLLLLIPILSLGCASDDASSDAQRAAAMEEWPSPKAESRGLTGRWALVDQRGYDSNHPRDVEQVLTFDDRGRMTNLQSSGGQSLAMVMTYRVEGDRILAEVESAEMNGEPLDLGEGTPQQTYRWQIVAGRLILEGSEPGTQDVYHRDD